MQFRPCIDLHSGRVKQIVGSSLSDANDRPQTNFTSDLPAEHYARMYAADQLHGGHVIMLGPGNENAAKAALNVQKDNLQIGGGINLDNACQWLNAGAGQLIMTSFIFANGEIKIDNLKKLASLVPPDKLVLDLSCRRQGDKYMIVTDRWQKFTNVEVNRQTLDFLSSFCCEFLIHAVDVEGKQSGIDAQLLQIMAENSPIECVYAGGITSFDDIKTIFDIGQNRIHFTVGSALDIFGGAMAYREVINFTRQLNHE